MRRIRMLGSAVVAFLMVLGLSAVPAAAADFNDTSMLEAGFCTNPPPGPSLPRYVRGGPGSGPQGNCVVTMSNNGFPVPATPTVCLGDPLSFYAHIQDQSGAGVGQDFDLFLSALFAGGPSFTYVADGPAPEHDWDVAQISIPTLPPPGTYKVTIATRGTSYTDLAGKTHDVAPTLLSNNVTFTNNCSPPPPPGGDFTLSLTPNTATVSPGAGTQSQVTVAPLNGFNQPVSLSISPSTPLPPNTGVSFSPPQAAGPSWSSTMSLTTGPATPLGTFTFDVVGNAGPISRRAPFTLNVSRTTPVGGTPPSFSQTYASSFPDLPFRSCLVGQFEAPPTGESGPQAWYVKAIDPGDLTVEVTAVSVNAAESGTITGRLFDASTNAPIGGPIVVSMPASGSHTVGMVVPGVAAGQIFRLDVTRTDNAGQQVGHHYTVGFLGLPVNVGLSSPTWQAFEHGHHLYKVNAVAGETVSLDFLQSTNPGTPSHGAVEVFAPNASSVASRPDSPLPYSLAFTAATTGTYSVDIDMEDHWTMARGSSLTVGADLGIYIDTCPVDKPPVQDQDNDTVPDTIDNCPTTPNPGQENLDGDAQGDACDPDDDNDTVPDTVDNCPSTVNAQQVDSDGDGLGNACDADDDNDGVLDAADNCEFAVNPLQLDSDNDGQGDACDPSIAIGRMTGGGSVFTEAGARVTHGFTVYCTPSEGVNNLQVNWGRSGAFHLLGVTSAYCGDDPNINAGRPAADGFDTYVGRGTGRLNDGSAATIEWRFTDAGEPGRYDTARIVIRNSSGAVILEAGGNLDRGNHQTHG